MFDLCYYITRANTMNQPSFVCTTDFTPGYLMTTRRAYLTAEQLDAKRRYIKAHSRPQDPRVLRERSVRSYARRAGPDYKRRAPPRSIPSDLNFLVNTPVRSITRRNSTGDWKLRSEL